MKININFNGFECFYNELLDFFSNINWNKLSTGEVLFYDTASQFADYDFAIMEIKHNENTVQLMAITSNINEIDSWYCDAAAYQEVEQKTDTDTSRLVLFAMLNEYDLIKESELTIRQYNKCKEAYHRAMQKFKSMQLFKDIQEYVLRPF